MFITPSAWLATILVLLSATAGCTPDAPPQSQEQTHVASSAAAASPAPTGSATTNAHPEAVNLEKKREKALAQIIRLYLEESHLRRKKVNDQTSREAFGLFLEGLDPAKTFLLEEHVTQLRDHELTMDDELANGNFALVERAHALMQKRVKQVLSLLDELAKNAFDLNKDEELETDPEKRQWAQSEQELAQRWRKILKHIVVQRIVDMEELLQAPQDEATPLDDDALEARKKALAEIPKDPAGRERKAREKTVERYRTRLMRIAQEDRDDHVEGFLNAITRTYDPHTMYLPPASKENFDIRMSGSLEGIGAVLSADRQFIKVMRIVPGSASWRQGDLEAGDLIMAVAQQGEESVDIADMRLRDVVRLIRGPKDSKVTLTVKKPDDRIMPIAIVRDVVKLEATYARAALLNLPGSTKKIGYIDVPSFYGNTRDNARGSENRTASYDVKRILKRFKSQKINAMILDLRGNGGGLLSDARKMAGLFIAEGPIVQTIDVNGDKQVLRDKDDDLFFGGRLVVMVDRFSASASEIVAGALQDYGRAVIIGSSQTHGKGTVQALLRLDGETDLVLPRPLGVLKLTRQQFFRVGGDSTQHRGIVPDLMLRDSAAHIESGERYRKFSIPWSKTEPLSFDPWPVGGQTISTLREKSEKRQAADPTFQKVNERSAFLKELNEKSVEPLALNTWRAKNKTQTNRLKALSLDNKENSEALITLKLLDYDGTLEQSDPPKHPTRKTGKSPREFWIERVQQDAWLAESMRVLQDMR